MDGNEFYTEAQRTLQREQGVERLADTVAGAIVWSEIDEMVAGFIESRDYFFLATVDGSGMPTVSYKGGPPGVVHVVSPTEVIFPAYDGNAMFLSMGNAAETGKVGLLFIDFETPNRIRLQGNARVVRDDPDLGRYPGAKLLVRVAVTSVFLNCARYIHKHTRVETSPYVPDGEGKQPHPSWKRIDFVQEALPEEDRRRTEAAGGTIDQDGYTEHLMEGRS